MGGNSFGILFRVVSFGESHGRGLGCVVDGCPAGLPLTEEDIRKDLARRRPGSSKDGNESGISSSRGEADEPEILSGVFEGKTLGTPIAILVRNKDAQPGDYEELKDVYRPSHADWPWEAKYGFRDHRGGGRTSGRETLGRVAAGAVARVFLGTRGITIRAWTSSAAGIDASLCSGEGQPIIDWDEIDRNPLRMPDKASSALALEKMESLKALGDSAGCSVSCMVQNLPPGLGEPVFDKLDARIASAMLSIGAAKAVEFGAGFAASMGLGSDLNDSLVSPGVWETNNSGGVLGGLSNGADLRFKVAFKPIPSIGKKQKTINRRGEKTELVVGGRHDICAAPRVVPVVEAMAALVVADLLLLQRCARV